MWISRGKQWPKDRALLAHCWVVARGGIRFKYKELQDQKAAVVTAAVDGDDTIVNNKKRPSTEQLDPRAG